MTPRSSDGWYEALWPRAPRRVGVKALAPRLAALEGKTVAQLWDDLYLGDKVFALLEERLAQLCPGVRWVSWKEFGSTHGGNEREVLARLPQRFRELGVDAAVSGMAC